MKKDWKFFADKILDDLDKVYPRTKSYLVIRRHTQPRLREHERLLDEALTFLTIHNLVDKVSDSMYRINKKGKSVKASGLNNYIVNLSFPEQKKEETNGSSPFGPKLLYFFKMIGKRLGDRI